MLEDLFAQVYASPDDDEVRRILADALTEAGDPRGELITFQLHPDVDYQRRAMRLVQQNGLRWLGALRGAVIPLGYERGFLAHAQVVDTEAAAILRDHREWATLHTLELADTATPPAMLGPSFRSLTKLVNANVAALTWMVAQPPTELPPRIEAIRATSKGVSLARLANLPSSIRTITYRDGSSIQRGDDGRFYSQLPSS